MLPIPPQSIHIGPITLYYYSLCLLVGFFAGIMLAKYQARKFQFEPKIVDDLIPWVFVGGLVGARGYHVIDRWGYYHDHLWEIVAVWQGGIGFYGGLLGGLLLAFLFARKHKHDYLHLLDLFAPPILLAQAIGRIGNYFNQEAFGPPTNLPWKIYIDPLHRPSQWLPEPYFHPLFLYESLLNFIGFGVLFIISKKTTTLRGFSFGLYAVWYGAVRLLLEQLRFDTAQLYGVKVATIISALVLVLGCYLIYRSVTTRST